VAGGATELGSAGCDPDSIKRPARRSRGRLNNILVSIPRSRASFDTDTPSSHAAVAQRYLKTVG